MDSDKWIATQWTRLTVHCHDDGKTFVLRKASKNRLKLKETNSECRSSVATIRDASSFHIGGKLTLETKHGKSYIVTIDKWDGPSHSEWPDEEDKVDA